MTTTKDEFLRVGKVSGPFGVRGWVKISSYTQPPANILEYSPWYLFLDGQWQQRNIVDGKIHGKGIIVLFRDIDDRDAVARLTHCDIAISRSQLPPAAPGEYYWTDLEGLRVTNTQDQDLGVVSSLFETGANDVMVVAGDRERLIPFIKDQVIIKVDIAGGYILVDWDADF